MADESYTARVGCDVEGRPIDRTLFLTVPQLYEHSFNPETTDMVEYVVTREQRGTSPMRRRGGVRDPRAGERGDPRVVTHHSPRSEEIEVSDP